MAGKTYPEGAVTERSVGSASIVLAVCRVSGIVVITGTSWTGETTLWKDSSYGLT